MLINVCSANKRTFENNSEHYLDQRSCQSRTFVDGQLQDRWGALKMSGDEALGRVAMDALT